MGAGRVTGKVVAVGPSGNLITDISLDRLQDVPDGLDVTVQCDEHQTFGIFPADHQQPEMTLVAVRGTSGFLELQLVGESAQRFLGIRVGADVAIRW